MKASDSTTGQVNKPSKGEENKPGFRTKTIATRLTRDELATVESAAEQAEKPLSEWLREMALMAAREQPANPIELVLAELWALRYALVNLFHAEAQASFESKRLLPESVVNIRDRADARKTVQARKLLEEFLASRAAKRSNRP